MSMKLYAYKAKSSGNVHFSVNAPEDGYYKLLGTVDTEDVKEEETYPCYKRGNNDGMIVRFIAPERGTVIMSGLEGGTPPGHYSDGWFEENFTRINIKEGK